MKRKKFIGVAILLVVTAVVELKLGLPIMPEGALRHTLLMNGYWNAAFGATCADVSNQAAQYMGVEGYELDPREQLYLLSGEVPRNRINGIPMDTWTVEASGLFYHCEFSGKG